MNEKEDELQIMRDLTEKYSSLLGNIIESREKDGLLTQTSIFNEREGVVVSKNLVPSPKLQTKPEDSHWSYWCSWRSYSRPSPFLLHLSNHLSRPCFFSRSGQCTSEQITSPTPKSSNGALQANQLLPCENFRSRTRTLTCRLQVSR